MSTALALDSPVQGILELPKQGDIWRVKSGMDLSDMLSALRAAKVVGYDIETTGLSPRQATIRTLQFYPAGGPCFVLDLLDWEQYGEPARHTTLADLREWLGSGRSLIVAHNASFEWGFTAYRLGVDIPRLYCTMVAELLLTAGKYHKIQIARKNAGLAAVTLRRFGIELDKTLQTSFMDGSPLSDEQYEYAAWDAFLVLPIYREQLKELKSEGLLETMQLETKVTRVLAGMELRGFPFNAEKRRAAYKPLAARLLALDSEISAALADLYRDYREDTYNEQWDAYRAVQDVIEAGLADKSLKRGSPEIQELYAKRPPKPKMLPEELNVNSNPIMLALFQRAGVDLPNLQADTIKERSSEHPILSLMAEYNELSHECGIYGDGLLARVEMDGRIHPEFNQIVSTGRTSSEKPNAQNFPKHVRACLEAPQGRALVVADFSNLELRVLAGLSQDTRMLAAFAEGRDLHTEAASEIFGVPYDPGMKEETHPHYQQRHDGKTVNFGIAFGLSEYGLSRQIDRGIPECKAIIAGWSNAFPQAWEYLENNGYFAITNYYASTAGGRKRYFRPLPHKGYGYDREYERMKRAIQNEGKNAPIQGTAGDISKRALVLIEERLREQKLDAYLINFVHDEVLLESSERDAEKAKEIVAQSMRDAGAYYFHGNPEITADAKIVERWSK